MNPYEVLGIDRDATHARIRAAYRRAVMKHHPDKGGDPKKFEEVQKAHEVLTDPDRRAHYDATGDMGEAKAPDHMLHTIINAFNGAIGAIIASGKEPEYADLIHEMKLVLQQTESDMKGQLVPLETGLARLAKLAGRFTAPEGRADYFSIIIQGQISDINNRMRPLHEAMEQARAARLYLDGCQFRQEKIEQITNIVMDGAGGGGRHPMYGFSVNVKDWT